jgi:CheY-like chemotaxis protein/anti-sigma regulatory factor (Ser/Thr protein kinase)
MEKIKKKLLLIDDVEENLIVLKERLEKEGYNTISAYDGASGIQLAIQELPDLILCDIMMPHMDGYQVMEILHDNPYTNTIPFIFLTAKTDPKDFRIGMQLGADDYITKPFNSKQLLKAVQTRLERKEVFDSKTEEITNSISYALPHELQTPLTVIMGFTQLLIEDYYQIERSKILEIAVDIQSAAKKLSKLVQKVLFSTKLDLIFTNIEKLRELKSHVVNNPKQIITETVLKIGKEYDRGDDIVFEVDDAKLKFSESYLKSIMTELADNALKFSEKGTRIQITGVQNENEYSIYVIDNGRGMSDKQISMLGEFMQFERKNYEQSGAGLGLSIVKKIAEIFNSEIHIESIPEKETMVRVTIVSIPDD